MFKPLEDSTATKKIPYIEDARSDYAPYYSSSVSVQSAQAAVAVELGKLGGILTAFVAGVFDLSPKRYGYEIRFLFAGRPGVIRVAGLPIKAKETDAKLKQVRVQALLVVRDWLKSSVTSAIFAPNSNILYQHLLVDQNQTIADLLVKSGQLYLPSGDVVEGEFEIVDE